MTCRICGYHKVCQAPGCKDGKVRWGTKESGMPMITKGAPGSSEYVNCSHCHGTGYCPVNNK